MLRAALPLEDVCPRQQEAGTTLYVLLCMSSHGDNVMQFQAENFFSFLSMMHGGSEPQSQHNITSM